MKPTVTSHIARSILRELGSDIRIDGRGCPIGQLSFPIFGSDPVTFRSSYLAYNLVRKISVSSDRPTLLSKSEGIFHETESDCVAQDSSFLNYLRDPTFARIMLAARQVAQEVLGDKVPRRWLSECCFTGGASTSRSRLSSNPVMKWSTSGPFHVTPLAYPLLLQLIQSWKDLGFVFMNPDLLHTEHDRPREIVLTPGSRIEFVDKDYKSLRTIAIEPDGNMLLQKGIGNIIREKLVKVGIDLNDQTKNQRLALEGSLSGELATIDLSRASDSISMSLVEFLVPEDWFSYLYKLRSPCYSLNGEWHTMRKMSSMGNGFTFELESLLFFAICEGVRRIRRESYPVSVYGDDIIVSSAAAKQTIGILFRCGFSVNSEKSFWDGPFRESCGKHYFNGVDVSPVHIKAPLDTLEERFRLYNQLRFWEDSGFSDPSFLPVSNVVLKAIPLTDRRQIPLEFDETSGIRFGDVCTDLIRHKQKRSGHLLSFSAYCPTRIDLTSRFADECLWFYNVMNRWQPSDPDGSRDYTRFSYIRNSARAWARVSAPACHAVSPKGVSTAPN